MTILAALLDGSDNVVVAADGCQWILDPVLKAWMWEDCDKFMRVPETGDSSLAWGYTGCGEGDQFIEWFATESFESWNDLKSKLARKIVRVNETPIDSAEPQLGVIRDSSSHQINVVVAGFIHGERGFVGMDPLSGIHNRVGEALFVGTGALESANPMWRVMIEAGRSQDLDLLKEVLETLIDGYEWLRAPLNLWRCTANAFSPV